MFWSFKQCCSISFGLSECKLSKPTWWLSFLDDIVNMHQFPEVHSSDLFTDEYEKPAAASVTVN